jgi:hypothetical protein
MFYDFPWVKVIEWRKGEKANRFSTTSFKVQKTKSQVERLPTKKKALHERLLK